MPMNGEAACRSLTSDHGPSIRNLKIPSQTHLVANATAPIPLTLHTLKIAFAPDDRESNART